MSAFGANPASVRRHAGAFARDVRLVARDSRATVAARAARLAFLALILAAAALAAPRTAGAQATITIADLDWLEGAWVLERTGERLEEWWSAPVGNSMVGHFRWIRNGALWITELVSITEEAGEIVFRLRHFSATMKPWEAEDDGFLYRLTGGAAGRAAFTIAEPRAGRPNGFIFEALPGDSLLVRLVAEEGGQVTHQDFRYGRGR